MIFILDISENGKGSTASQSYVTMLNQENLCRSLYTSDYSVLVRAKTCNVVYLFFDKLA